MQKPPLPFDDRQRSVSAVCPVRNPLSRSSVRPTGPLSLGFSCVLIFSLLLLPSHASRADSPRTSTDSAQFTELVKRLRSASFQARLQAESECRRSGSSVIPALVEALQSSDPELRRRAQMLIERIEEDELASSIADFLEPGSTTILPGWSFVVDLVEETPEFRAAYAELLRNDSQLARALAHPQLIGPELVRQLQKFGPLGRSQLNQSLSTDRAAVLLLLIHPNATYPVAIAGQSYLAISPGMTQADTSTPAGQLFHALVTRWVITPNAGMAIHRLTISSNPSLPESLVPAREVIQQKINGDRQHLMDSAFQAIAQYGGAEDMAEVEQLLDDEFELEASQGEGEVKKSSKQIRDLALATLIAMTAQDSQRYGLKPLTRDSDGKILNFHEVSFPNDTQRAAAFESWRAWSRTNLRKFRPLPPLAEEGVSL